MQKENVLCLKRVTLFLIFFSSIFKLKFGNVFSLFFFLIKVWALVQSGSLAVVASLLDSCLDLLSQV